MPSHTITVIESGNPEHEALFREAHANIYAPTWPAYAELDTAEVY